MADLAGELLPSGRYAHPTMVVLLPRQSGKTTTVKDLLLGRGLRYRNYRCAYTAQTGHLVTERFTEWIEELEDVPLLDARLRMRRSQGTERITARKNRSHLRAFPPKDGALRSSANDAVVFDEDQEHDEKLGLALDRTAIPTFATRPRRQLWIVGTAGTAASAHLLRYLTAARAGTPGYGLVEFGAREGEDTDDEAIWWLRHPGLVYGLTDVDAMRQARMTLGYAGFAREYFNVWFLAAERLIDPKALSDAFTDDPMPAGRVALAVDVAADRTHACIGAAQPGQKRFLELIGDRHDVDAAAAEVIRVSDRQDRAPIVCDKYGPTGTVHDELTRLLGKSAEQRLLTPTAQDIANAYGDFIDDLDARALRIKAHPLITAAAEVAGRRRVGDEGWTWSRRGSAGSIAPLVALTNAGWGAQRLPAPPLRPEALAG